MRQCSSTRRTSSTTRRCGSGSTSWPATCRSASRRSSTRCAARVMIEIGGVAPSDEVVLRQPKVGELVHALEALTRRVADAKRAAAGGRTEVIVYYSGHADEQGLLLGDDRYSYRSLRERLDEIPADVRIAVLDACASGAFTRVKGGRARPPFLVDESAA